MKWEWSALLSNGKDPVRLLSSRNDPLWLLSSGKDPLRLLWSGNDLLCCQMGKIQSDGYEVGMIHSECFFSPHQSFWMSSTFMRHILLAGVTSKIDLREGGSQTVTDIQIYWKMWPFSCYITNSVHLSLCQRHICGNVAHYFVCPNRKRSYFLLCILIHSDCC